MVKSLCIVIPLLISACGSSKTKANHQPEGQSVRHSSFPLVIEAAASMPDCVELNESQLIYLREANEFRFCSAGVWEPIDLKGQAGADGQDGKVGAKGENGTAGSPGQRGFSMGYVVTDATGALIGYPDSPALNNGDRFVVFVDGYIGQLRASYGEILPGNNTCHYELSDCSGTCFSIYGPSHPDGNHLLQNVSDKSLMKVERAEANLGEWYFGSRWNGDGSCEAVHDFAEGKFKSTPWNPKGFDFPLRKPLKVELTSKVLK